MAEPIFNSAFGGGLRSGAALADLLQQRQQRSQLQQLAQMASQPNVDYQQLGAGFIGAGLPGAGINTMQIPAQQQVAQQKLELDRFKANQPPNSVQEFLYGQQNPAYNSWRQSNARAGATNVNVNAKYENEYDKTLGDANAKRYIGLQEEAQGGRRAVTTLDAMENLLDQDGFYSGAGGDSLLGLKRVGRAIGLDPEGIESTEAFNALSKQAALDTMGGSLGTGFSNADRDFVIDQVPNLGNTPEGNRALIRIQRKLAERKVKIGELADRYARQNGRLDRGFDAALQQWAETQPPLFDDSLLPKRKPAVVTGDDDVDALIEKYSQ